MEQKTIMGVAALIVVIVVVAAAVALTYNGGSNSDNEGGDGGGSGTIPENIQDRIDYMISERQNVADNMVPQIVDAFADAEPELLSVNNKRSIAQSAFEFADTGREFNTMGIFYDSSCPYNYKIFQSIPLYFQSVWADDRWGDFNKNVVVSNASGDSEEFSANGSFVYLPGILSDDFTTMLWSGGYLYSSSDAILQSEDGEILQVRAGYHEYGSFDTLELWRFPPGTCFAGNFLPTPGNEGYNSTSLSGAIVIGDGNNGVMVSGNRFISMATCESYESFVIDLLWECEGYSGSVEQDFSDGIGAYDDFVDRLNAEVQATYDLAEECYYMNPEDRPWELTVGYTPPSTA